MRVLAVIPACEGSVVFPNKNMRVIQGKPLIYYVIKNAMQSRYITDVIVTSNSNEILSLGRQMGTLTRKRKQELCNIKVSLDSVVWDVFEQLNINDYDYIVTMQSISPTLKVKTLDAAFEEIFANDYDTLISVKNQAHFYWKMQGKQPVPLQNQRMNRNMLPPFYMETGAFLITKASCVKGDTRIGKKVGLYELTGDESIDINNFGDLKLADNALNRKNAAIFVNGNSELGLGHITRTLQIADELFTKPDFYYDRKITDPVSFGNTTYSLIPVDGADGFLKAMAANSYDLIINDVLNTTEAFMKDLRKITSSKIVNFEDNGTGAEYANVVFNALYENSKYSNVVCGSEYFIIPKQFLIYPPVPIRNAVKNVLVSFGGADPRNYSKQLLDIAVKKQYSHLHFFIVLGIANHNFDMVDSQYNQSNITILCDIDNMAEVMSNCDVAVSSRGRTCFELAAMGIPTLSIAQHEREEQHTFVCEKNGFLCLDSHATSEAMEKQFYVLTSLSVTERKDRQKKMLANDLKNGRRNLVERILKLWD